MFKSANYYILIILIGCLFIGCSKEDDLLPVIENPPVEPVYEKIYVNGTQTIIDSYTLKNFLSESFSEMYYYNENFDQTQGGSYILNYKDEGGSGMDSYPNITIGGVKKNGTWDVGNKDLVGMPIQLSTIPNTMNFEFTTSQENANDDNDKWMASINFIFDNYGIETSEPTTDKRDYDLVVMHTYHNFDDSIEDKPIGTSTTHWYFARNNDFSLKPYKLTIDGEVYTYAVRYKFFVNSGSKDNKAHVKFIPYGNNSLPATLKVNVKEIIACSKNYLQYANIPSQYKTLAESNIALDQAWLKSLNAGYEVYTGNSTLKIDKFKVTP